MSELSIRHKRRFGVVPDYILEEKKLSLGARAVAAWLAGRQDGFSIKVEAMREIFLGITERRWKTIREELQLVGWWRSTRKKKGNGKFEWTHEFSDTGFSISDSEEEKVAIPTKCRDGKGIDDSCSHAPLEDNQKDFTNLEIYQEKPTTEPQLAYQNEINMLIEAAIWQRKQSGGVINNINAWKHSIRKRLQTYGPSPEDIQALKDWQAYLKKFNDNSKRVKYLKDYSPIKKDRLDNINSKDEIKLMLAMLKERKYQDEDNE